MRALPVGERIRASVTIDERGCWVWQKSTLAGGYGQIWVGSRTDGTRRRQVAHRASYEAFVGPVPDGLFLDHLCRNRACVNPDHLEPVSTQTNIRRGVAPPAINAAKTHCKRGHEFTLENTYMNQGKRYCRQCRAAAHGYRVDPISNRWVK